ncbi:MAG: VCBS repeat-containing protein [Phycisphaerae bacterium]|jgi:hypothetical protein|nr:VCBS repeat-containing protein [Phycisphaerae bacterium]
MASRTCINVPVSVLALILSATLGEFTLASPSPAPPAFSNQTNAIGIGISHATSGFAGSAWAGGGAVGDFNRDGWSDLFILSGGSGNRADYLFINNGNGTFTDRAALWGLSAIHRGKSACVGDFDGDGWLDLYVTSAGAIGVPAAGQHKLYRNNGGTSFTNVAATAGVAFADPTTESAWTSVFGDYDLDGDLDLFVGGYAGAPSYSEQHLFRNNGNATFTDVTPGSGILSTALPMAPNAARFIDLNGDRYPELLVVADFKGPLYAGSRCFHNNGDGTFTDTTVAMGLGLEEYGMGVTTLDVENDGRLDLYVTNIDLPPSATGNKLYHAVGNGTFTQNAVAAGVAAGSYGWGSAGVDVNHDGWEDLVETNGDATPGSAFYDDPSYLWMNSGDGTFIESGAASGLLFTQKGRALMRLDADNDGDQDIVIVRNNGPLAFFRNDLVHVSGTSWLRVFLTTDASSGLAPNGFGAIVHVMAGGVERMRVIDGGVGYLSTSELSAHFGLGSAGTVESVRVTWPNGHEQTLTNLAANQTITIAYQPPCSGDVNGDGSVGPADLGLLLGAWGTRGSGGAADLDGNGVVGPPDLAILLGAWGGCP